MLFAVEYLLSCTPPALSSHPSALITAFRTLQLLQKRFPKKASASLEEDGTVRYCMGALPSLDTGEPSPHAPGNQYGDAYRTHSSA